MINHVEKIKSLWRAGSPIAAAVAFSWAFSLLLSGQSANFRGLQALIAMSCESGQSANAENRDAASELRCQTDLNLPTPSPYQTGHMVRDGQDLALLIPVFRDYLVVTVNGVTVGQARLNQWRMPARLATMPTIISLPRQTLKPGINRLEIEVRGLAGREPSLGRTYIGPEADALAQFHRLWFIGEILPTLILGGQAALALMFFTIWNRRRQEAALGWFSLVLALDTFRGSAVIPALGAESASVSYWSLLVPFSSAAYVMFARALVGLPNTNRSLIVWIAPAFLSLAAILAAPSTATGVLMPLGVIVIGANLVWASIVLVIGWRRQVPETRLLLFCTLLFAGLVLHDVLLSLRVIEGQMAVARPGLLVVLVAMITLMIKRFTGAMTELDRTAEILRIRTTEIEARLTQADEQLRAQREAAILAQERARLMRDLHDGLGGEMVAVLALAERDTGKGPDIAYHARAALSDMRLIIASLEDYGGDLAMALGAWKERAEPQMVAAGLKLHWELNDLGTRFQFGPTQILDILRILQEALANVIHHADATIITVGACLADGELALSFTDNGKGFRHQVSRGKGLTNMHSRAANLGGRLDIDAANHGTSIVLRLPV